MLERMATTTNTHNTPFTSRGEAGSSANSGPFSARAPSLVELVLVSGKLLLADSGWDACSFSSETGTGSLFVDMTSLILSISSGSVVKLKRRACSNAYRS